MNVQVVTDLAGQVLWISPALPGRVHDLTAAGTQRIIRICERQGVADRAYPGAGPSASNAHLAANCFRRSAQSTEQLAQARAPVERGMARLKSWRIFRRSHVAQPHDANRRSHPHPGEATLKTLSNRRRYLNGFGRTVGHAWATEAPPGARRGECAGAIQRTFGARRGRGKSRGARRRCLCLPCRGLLPVRDRGGVRSGRNRCLCDACELAGQRGAGGRPREPWRVAAKHVRQNS
ncbi:transposase family protein [Streptomyces avermitilis]|uniref:transposase family protein n=1 Tax=Streptomyces avermitilis TaxID=33903 RepID=UPI003F541F20